MPQCFRSVLMVRSSVWINRAPRHPAKAAAVGNVRVLHIADDAKAEEAAAAAGRPCMHCFAFSPSM